MRFKAAVGEEEKPSSLRSGSRAIVAWVAWANGRTVSRQRKESEEYTLRIPKASRTCDTRSAAAIPDDVRGRSASTAPE